MATGSSIEISDSKSIGSGKNISKDDFKKMNDVLESINWQFNYSPKELKAR